MMRFDRFTERAQEAAQRAAEIIQRYGHNQIDTEHILLALIEQPGGVIPQILEKLSVSPEALTERLDATARCENTELLVEVVRCYRQVPRIGQRRADAVIREHSQAREKPVRALDQSAREVTRSSWCMTCKRRSKPAPPS